MQLESPVLAGKHVRLEPLDLRHVDGLVAAAANDRSLYQWSPVPQGKAEATSYVETALAWRHEGSAVPFAIVERIMERPASPPGQKKDGAEQGAVIGSTRFFNLERWAWPPG